MSEDTNEILAAAQAAKAAGERAKRDARSKRDGDWPIGAIGLGVGIGSAAVAAALLYANRNRAKRDD